MIKFYTAVGQYKVKKDEHNNCYPAVTTKGKEHCLGIQEMIIWSSLMWNIHTFDELSEIFYTKEREVHVLGDSDFESYLTRLEERGLVISGRDYTTDNALYALLSKFYIIPLLENIITKACAFLHLTFKRNIPLEITRKIFVKPDLNYIEKNLLRLSKQAVLTMDELIKCSDKKVKNILNEQELLKTLYGGKIPDEKNNPDIPGRFSRNCPIVMQGIINLYLHKQIMFEQI